MRWVFYLLIIIIIFISGISGCDTSNYNLSSYVKLDKKTSGSVNSGLIISFDPNRPPSGRILSDQDSFQVVVNLENTGKKSINGNLCVSDVFLGNDYGGIMEPDCKSVSLGDPETGISPSEEKIFFPSFSGEYRYSGLSEYFSQVNTISAVFDYGVSSVSGTQLCIKSDPDIKLPSGINCPDSEIISSNIENLPAPIVVSSISKDVISSGGSSRLKLELKLRKIDDGEVDGVVNYRVRFLGGNELDCSGTNQLLFDKNEKIIKCGTTLNLGQQGYINQLLEIQLNYKYRKRISTSFELKNEPIKGQV